MSGFRPKDHEPDGEDKALVGHPVSSPYPGWWISCSCGDPHGPYTDAEIGLRQVKTERLSAAEARDAELAKIMDATMAYVKLGRPR